MHPKHNSQSSDSDTDNDVEKEIPNAMERFFSVAAVRSVSELRSGAIGRDQFASIEKICEIGLRLLDLGIEEVSCFLTA